MTDCRVYFTIVTPCRDGPSPDGNAISAAMSSVAIGWLSARGLTTGEWYENS